MLQVIYMSKRELSRLEQELMLQINESLFRQGLLTQELYEQAKIHIVKRNST